MDEFEWNVINEGQLLDAMVGHKPVGINKYFQMAFICDKFNENHREIRSDKVWTHLETMYNLEALDDSESIPFPNSEKDFALPESEYGPLIAKKEEDKKAAVQIQKGRETPKAVKEKEVQKKEEKSEKTPVKGKEVQRRDSKDSSKDSKEKTPASAKKEIKKEPEKSKSKGKSSNNTPKDEAKTSKNKDKDKEKEETPKLVKRPTRGSLKDDSGSSGKSSPITVTPTNAKRRRI